MRIFIIALLIVITIVSTNNAMDPDSRYKARRLREQQEQEQQEDIRLLNRIILTYRYEIPSVCFCLPLGILSLGFGVLRGIQSIQDHDSSAIGLELGLIVGSFLCLGFTRHLCRNMRNTWCPNACRGTESPDERLRLTNDTTEPTGRIDNL